MNGENQLATGTQEKNSASAFKWKGKPGYSGKGRPTFALLGKDTKKPRVNKWKDIMPEYNGRGKPSHDLLVKYGFAEPKPNEPGIASAADAIPAQKPDPIDETPAEFPATIGDDAAGQSHDEGSPILEKGPGAEESELPDDSQAIMKRLPLEFIIDRESSSAKEPATIEEVDASLNCKPMGRNRKCIDPYSPLQVNLRSIEKMETNAQKLTDSNSTMKASAVWLEIADKYASMGLFSAAALRFKKANAWEKAGKAFMKIKEYKQAAEAFSKAAGQEDAANKAYMMAGKAAEKEFKYRLAELMFSRGGHDTLANEMAEKERRP